MEYDVSRQGARFTKITDADGVHVIRKPDMSI